MTIRINTNLQYDGREISNNFPDYTFGSNTTGTTRFIVESFKVAASASDEALSIQALNNVEFVLLEDPNDSGKLTVKLNSESNARNVQPYHMISEDLDSITVSSSDTENAQYLRIITAIIQ